MRRRDFIQTIIGAAAWPVMARAQQPKYARLGYLAPATNPDLQEALLAPLRDLGYVEGQNLAIEYRFALGQSKTYDELAAELAHMTPDAIGRRHTTSARGEAANYHHSHYHGTRRRSPAQRPCR